MKNLSVIMKFNLLFVIFIFFLFSFGMTANTQVVAVSCIESEHNEKLPSDVTLYFENTLLGFLFNEGFIVTSLPYKKENFDNFKRERVEDLQFENDPDFIILLYFMYEENRKYDEFKRKNLLPCIQISLTILDLKRKASLINEDFLLNDMSEKLMYKKVDALFLKIKEKILKSIRRTV